MYILIILRTYKYVYYTSIIFIVLLGAAAAVAVAAAPSLLEKAVEIKVKRTTIKKRGHRYSFRS